MRTRLRAAGLLDIADTLDARQRLSAEDGLRLFEHPDLRLVGWLANRERERRHGDRTFYNYNLRLEVTNVCQASCLFCSFARLQEGQPGAYTMSLEQAWDKVRSREGQALTEVHIVNGLHPHLPFSYYTDLLAGFKRIRPDIILKAFTAVEIAFFADLYGMTDEQVLRELMAVGLESIPGGGAEIFADRVRKKIANDKADADRYLSIHAIAHRLGMKTNVTMLFGHIERLDERVDHMVRVREAQDATGGFQAFIPLTFHPDNNQMRKLPPPTAADTLRDDRRLAADARQRRPHQGVLDRDGRVGGAGGAVVRRRRPRRHRAGRAHLPHGRVGHARHPHDRAAASPRRGGRAHPARARHDVQPRRRVR